MEVAVDPSLQGRYLGSLARAQRPRAARSSCSRVCGTPHQTRSRASTADNLELVNNLDVNAVEQDVDVEHVTVKIPFAEADAFFYQLTEVLSQEAAAGYDHASTTPTAN